MLSLIEKGIGVTPPIVKWAFTLNILKHCRVVPDTLG